MRVVLFQLRLLKFYSKLIIICLSYERKKKGACLIQTPCSNWIQAWSLVDFSLTREIGCDMLRLWLLCGDGGCSVFVRCIGCCQLFARRCIWLYIVKDIMMSLSGLRSIYILKVLLFCSHYRICVPYDGPWWDLGNVWPVISAGPLTSMLYLQIWKNYAGFHAAQLAA